MLKTKQSAQAVWLVLGKHAFSMNFVVSYEGCTVVIHATIDVDGWTKKQRGLLITSKSGETDDSAIRQIRHSETLQSQSITATTQLSLNVTLWLHCEVAAEWSEGNEAEQRPRKRRRDRMKGQKDQIGRNCLNGTHWDEIGQRKESKEKRGPVEDENNSDLKIGMGERRGDLPSHCSLSEGLTFPFW